MIRANQLVYHVPGVGWTCRSWIGVKVPANPSRRQRIRIVKLARSKLRRAATSLFRTTQ